MPKLRYEAVLAIWMWKLTFMPSNRLVAYWKQEEVGSNIRGPNGLITGADHPLTGSNSTMSMWSVIVYTVIS
jgi:hypothetical protein